jgi:hypothetical protein
MLDDRQAFKVGFLRKCADAGLTIEETHAVVKQATAMVKSSVVNVLPDVLQEPYKQLMGAGGHALRGMGDIGLTAAIAGPAVLGAGAGYLAGQVTDVDDTDVKALKQQELIDEYHRQIELLNAKRRGVYRRPTPGLGA